MKTLILAAAAACLPVLAAAADTLPTVSDGLARSSNPQAGAAFMTIHNPGAADCTLSAASTPVAERAELHTHKDDNGVMKMMQVDHLTVPAGGELALKRGGDHIMLMGLKAPLKDGETVALTLDFGACGKVETALRVNNANSPAAAMPAMDHSTMSHDAMPKTN